MMEQGTISRQLPGSSLALSEKWMKNSNVFLTQLLGFLQDVLLLSLCNLNAQ